ncbi:nuclear transport factor 2 family protein [Nocardia sp. 2YAB30]|uniref:nuclear transport factor 2 family protein n=1 Tax=unclassified Nocardia TaxID=2637762 RepID=UPI003F9D7822
MSTDANRTIVANAFAAWSNGSAYISDIFADDMRWEITGRSKVAKVYPSKQAFVDEVLAPFGARFDPTSPFRPVTVRGTYADGDTVMIVWDGEGTTRAGTTYRNTYAWFMTLRDGLVVDATAFFDSIAFDELWDDVAPRP